MTQTRDARAASFVEALIADDANSTERTDWNTLIPESDGTRSRESSECSEEHY